ncbi:alcohol dehydrogenase [Moniliophthora roreri MCA 2997]|uniref:Alcohol dehydrogenase n=1 Tax=Moniliophthora roreri (strain MCA 2997) TaxID=1381753 RepID=V2X4Q2_MONRO|nr:alcohol dehydrogenase [Moniliophthora roreri MCA 2997]
MIIQLAEVDGMKLIAPAGTEGKVKECKEADTAVAFDYKNIDTAEVSEKGLLNILSARIIQGFRADIWIEIGTRDEWPADWVVED